MYCRDDFGGGLLVARGRGLGRVDERLYALEVMIEACLEGGIS